MKNASKHASTLRSLHKKLLKQHKLAGDGRPQLEPLRALVLAVLMEECDDQRAEAALAAFDAEFVDINELRVATELELADLIGVKYPRVVERSMRLRDLLMSLFDAEGRLAIDRLAALGKKDQRAAVRGMPQSSPFVEGFIALAGFGQAAVPLDEPMRAYLVAHDVLESDAGLEEAQRFLESNLKADECWPFFAACRAEARRRHAAAKATASAKPAGRKASKANAAKRPAATVKPSPKSSTKKTTSRQSA